MIAIGTYALLWILAAMLAVVSIVIVRDVSDMRNRVPEGPRQQNGLAPLGSAAPEFSAMNLRSGLPIRSADLRGRVTVLCMLSTGCRDCIELLEELEGVELGAYPQLVLYCSGGREACLAHLSRVPANVPVLVDGDSYLISEFRVLGLPVIIIMDEQWTIVGYRYPKTARDVIESVPREAARATDRHVA